MIIDPLFCSWDTSVFLMIFSNNVSENFVYYSHIFPTLCILIFAIVLLKQDPKNILVKILTIIGLAFAGWTFSDLVLWADADPDHIMFFWSILIHFEILIYIASFYFIYYFINKKLPGLRFELPIFFFSIPIFLFAHTSLNLVGFDYTNCLKEAIEGPLVLYAYILEIALSVLVLFYSLWSYHTCSERSKRKEILLVSLGTLLFLFSFSFGNIIGTLESDYEIGQLGLFATPLFIGILSYLSIRYKTFNLKAISSEILVISITLLIISILFNTKIENIRIITVFTAFVTSILGYMLIHTVKREIKQREQIEALVSDLEIANERLHELDKMKSEFVSIASHQLRSPLTSIRGYASMLAEGSYGVIPEKATVILNKIVESGKFMAFSIEDYLNVSRIEAGNMKYEKTDFNLKEVTEKVIDEMRSAAIKKGLVLMFRSDCSSTCTINADIGKTRQIIMNLIDNAIKYTPKGSVDVLICDNTSEKMLYVSIKDTGVGMNKDAIENLFEKFIRAKNANSINVTGTGLGLYVAKKMITSMGGRIWAESDGEGKGSTFYIQFPLV